MSDLREVFEMVTKQVEPDHDEWRKLDERRRRSDRNQKLGVYALVAAIALAAIVVGTRIYDVGGKQTPVGNGTQTGVPTGAPVGAQKAEIVGLDGSVARVIHGVPPMAYGFAVSPDGRTLAFVDGQSIATIPMAGGTPTILTGASIVATQPAWAPSGDEIAFSGTRKGNQDIYVMSADGSNLRRLTRDPAIDEWPSFSPDGTTIVYDNSGSTPLDDSGFSHTQELYRVAVRGGVPPTRLTSNNVDDSEPSYSPDGQEIAFHRAGTAWIMRFDGTNLQRLALPHVGTTGFTPRFSPDGTTIAYTAYEGRRIESDLFGLTQSLPLVSLHTVSLSNMGEHPTQRVDHIEMETDQNVPVWLPQGGGFLVNVPRSAP